MKRTTLEEGDAVQLKVNGEPVTGQVTGGPFNKQYYRVEHPHGTGKVERLVPRRLLTPVPKET